MGNPTNRSKFTPGKSKANYLLIGGIVLVCFILFGFGGYYLGTQSSKNVTDTTKAIDTLKAIPEIQNIEKSLIQAGTKPFYSPEGVNGDVVRVSLRESFPDDPHTTRIDTFNVNITNGIITVEDIINGGQISLEAWKEKINQSWDF